VGVCVCVVQKRDGERINVCVCKKRDKNNKCVCE
jgi:hypothetical protein